MENELKPCPFCGGEAKLSLIGNDAWQTIETAPKDGRQILVGQIYKDELFGCAVVAWMDINSADSEFGTVPHNPYWCWGFSDGHNDYRYYRGWMMLTHWHELPGRPIGRG